MKTLTAREIWANWSQEEEPKYSELRVERFIRLSDVEARDAKLKEILLSDWFEICKKQPDTAEKWARQYLPDADSLVVDETVIACVLKGTITRFSADYHDPTIVEIWEKSKIGVALLSLEEKEEEKT